MDTSTASGETSYGMLIKTDENGIVEWIRACGEEPFLDIKSISGGFGVSTVIENIGIVEATDVNWSIDLCGLVFFGGHRSGTVDISVGEEVTKKSCFVIGFGPVDITVTVAGFSKKASCFMLGPFILNVQET